MAISYQRLFDLLNERGLSSTYWLRQHGMHAATVNKLRKNERINTDTIDKLCEVLECRVEDIMEYVPNISHSEDKQQDT